MRDLTSIYSLSHPLNGIVRYIGKSNKPKTRFFSHVNDASVSKKTSWIKNLLLNDLLPVMNIIDEVPVCDWEFWEKHYIKLYKSCGADLVNSNEGGMSAPMSIETKLKQSKAKFGKKITEETRRIREKHWASKRGKPIFTSEQNKLYADMKRNKPVHPNTLIAIKKRAEKQKKQVSSYTLKGVLIKTYSSLKDAQKDTGVVCHVITKNYRKDKNYIQAKGMMFRLGNAPIITDFPKRRFSMMKPVIKMDLNDNFIAEFETVNEAARSVSSVHRGVHAVCQGARKTCKGFKWKYKI